MLVGTNKRISGPAATPRSESDIRVNYHDTRQIIAASNDIGFSGQPQFYSGDGGVRWFQTSLPVLPRDSFHTDPAVDWTSDGTAWAITIGIDVARANAQLRAYSSTDGGQTWNFDGTISAAQTSADKELVWVDHSPNSPFKDNIYVIWKNDQPVFVNRRTGPSGSWQNPVQISGGETTGTGIGSDIKTNSVGDVFAFWPDTGSQNLFLAKSTDGGATFGKPVAIAKTFGSFQIAVPADASRQALIYITGGAFADGTKDLVYAAWTDLSGAQGCTSGGGPAMNAASSCQSRIWFTRSTDGGVTWEAARMVNDHPSVGDQFNPRLLVDEANGDLVIMYYDTVADPARLMTDVWVQTSFDDGVNWSTPIKVTTAQTDETAAGADAGNQYGDYNGLSGYAGEYFPCWTDRRSGGTEEIWSVRINKLSVPLGYRPPDGLWATTLVDTNGLIAVPQLGPQFVQGLTHLIPTGNGFVFGYRRPDALTATALINADGSIDRPQIALPLIQGFTHVIPIGNNSILLYRAPDGFAATVSLGRDGSVSALQLAPQFIKGLTHLLATSNGFIFAYRAPDGLTATALINADGSLTPLQQGPRSVQGLTHLIPIGGDWILMYRSPDGLAATVLVNADGSLALLQQGPPFVQGTTHLEAVDDQTILTYRAHDGFAATALIDANGLISALKTGPQFVQGLTHFVPTGNGYVLGYRVPDGLSQSIKVNPDSSIGTIQMGPQFNQLFSQVLRVT